MPKRQTLPNKAALRSRLLGRIRAAHFPREVGSFTLLELQQHGFCEKYPKKEDISEGLYKLLVLLASQTEEFRQERDRLRAELEQLRPYYSLLFLQAIEQVDPLERERILELARADKARVANLRAAKQQAKEAEMERLVTLSSKKPWKSRDKRTPPRRAHLWHEPMTWTDYHRATGLSRKTIHNVLKRLKAVPLSERARRNEPSRFGPEVNLSVLREWLVRYVKQTDHRRAWLARTILKYRHEALDKFDSVMDALWPVFKSLSLDTADRILEFRDYLVKCDKLLYPPPPPPLLLCGI